MNDVDGVDQAHGTLVVFVLDPFDPFPIHDVDGVYQAHGAW